MEITRSDTLCMVGFDASVVGQLLHQIGDRNYLLIYEPDEKVVNKARHEEKYHFIFTDERVHLIAGTEDYQSRWWDLLWLLIPKGGEPFVQLLTSPGYDEKYPEICEECMEVAKSILEERSVARTTLSSRLTMIQTNFIRNLKYLISGSDLTLLKKQLSPEEIYDIPAIIVSAGPSLDKNIMELKKAEGKAFIVVIDSALKKVAEKGIDYQLGITVDPKKYDILFDHEDVGKKPLVALPYSYCYALEHNHSRIFFDNGGFATEVVYYLMENYMDHDYTDLRTGGDVATTAFSLVKELGFTKIILVGQDLAFTGGKSHTDGYFADQKADKEMVERESRLEVEGWNGEKLATNEQMKNYLEWYERRIRYAGNSLTVIDATEGGAKIQYTKPMRLNDAIAQYCNKAYNFNNVIASIPDTISVENQKKVKRNICALPEQLEYLKVQFQKYQQAYQEVRKGIRDGNVHSKEFEISYKLVSEANEIEKNEAFMKLISFFTMDKELLLDDVAWDEKKPIDEVLRAGEDMFLEYEKAIDHVSELLTEFPIE